MKWFQDQFAQSNVISGFVVVALVVVISYLAVTGQPIPEVLSVGFSTVVAFFFGSKMGQRDGYAQAMRQAEKAQKGVNCG